MNGPLVQVIRYVDEQPIEVHWFNLPKYGEPGFYRMTCSFNWFRDREGKRLVRWQDSKRRGGKVPMPARRTYMRFIGTPDTPMYELEMKYAGHKDLPQFHHADIWACYAAIGYDRAKQRYL